MSGTEHDVPARKRSKKFWWLTWILLGVIGGGIVYCRTPRIYRASTSVMIVPQRVPEHMVPSTVTEELPDRLNRISQIILSRTRLERIIEELDLYEEERGVTTMEDVVEQMR